MSKSWALPALLVSLSVSLSISQVAPKQWYGTPSPELQKDLTDFVDRAGVGGELGFAIYSVRQQRFEAAFNDSGFLVPASCLKLVVTAAALDTFPVNTYPATTLEVFGAIPHLKTGWHTLRGTLRVNGGGDPNISDRFFPDALTPLRPWVDSLKAMGIDTVRGQVAVSDTFFRGPHNPMPGPRATSTPGTAPKSRPCRLTTTPT